MRRLAGIILFGLLLVLSGCGQKSAGVEQDFEMDAVDSDRHWEFTAPSKEQKVTVLLRSAGVKLDVYVALAGEYPALKDQLERQAIVTAKVLAKKEQITEGQLEATVPAGQSYYVVIGKQTTKSVKASVKITTS
jgi:hypothetical protein